ncbi:MAG: hypothetical protein HYS80_01900 [Candidatus Aenigmarchaeota archaeon]|nr:hypothetical protein [Candidatus Aenigmarchaeota archaeon]
MSKIERLELIKQIQIERGSFVICYFVGDRPGSQFTISRDAIRKIYDHLKHIPKNSKIDLILYSSGGDASVPWGLVSIIREFANEFSVLVPFHAFSAATMIALGADSIIMCENGTLSPIDPAVNSDFNPVHEQTKQPLRINVEDVTSYISLLKEESKVGLKDQQALANVLKSLTEKVNPLALGYVNRHHSFIRLVAKKLLNSHRDKLDSDVIDKIVQELIEKIYFHGHSISRKEAKDIGLKIELPNENLENILWKLYLEYESEMKLNSPVVPEDILEDVNDDNFIEDKSIAVYLESIYKTDKFVGKLKISRVRRLPGNVNLSLNLQLPSGIDQRQLNPRVSEEINRTIQEAIREQLKQQAEVIGYQIKFVKFHWEVE